MSVTKSKIDAAVAAYIANVKISVIESEIGVHNDILYRELDRRGIERRGARKASRGWCEWCGGPLNRSRQKRFCCQQCVTDYNADVNDVDMSCQVCGGRVKRIEEECCSAECRGILAERRLRQDLRSVRLFTAGDLCLSEIARIIGKRTEQVRAMQALLMQGRS